MKNPIQIIGRGRGPQLSTSRITVQDLVPYLQRGMSYDQIIEIMPVLSVDEIQVVERYVREHHDEVMAQDARIRERNAARQNSPEIEEVLRQGGLKMAALREEFKKRKQHGIVEHQGPIQC